MARFLGVRLREREELLVGGGTNAVFVHLDQHLSHLLLAADAEVLEHIVGRLVRSPTMSPIGFGLCSIEAFVRVPLETPHELGERRKREEGDGDDEVNAPEEGLQGLTTDVGTMPLGEFAAVEQLLELRGRNLGHLDAPTPTLFRNGPRRGTRQHMQMVEKHGCRRARFAPSPDSRNEDNVLY